MKWGEGGLSVDKDWQGLLIYFMATVNISVTNDQLSWINKKTSSLGFSNRSEFVRSIIRFLAKREGLLSGVSDYPFTSPQVRNRKKILADFEKSGKYSSAFLKDLKQGLEGSSYFKK